MRGYKGAAAAGAVVAYLAAVIEFDTQHIWHPYTSMTSPLPAYGVRSARGVRLMLDDGRELVDGMSSWWCAIHGYNHPVLNAALRERRITIQDAEQALGPYRQKVSAWVDKIY